MSSMELEVKVLNIDKEEIVNKIKNAGGKYISSSEQYLCVYDLMYINQRFLYYFTGINFSFPPI